MRISVMVRHECHSVFVSYVVTCKYPVLNRSSLYILDTSGLAVVGTTIVFNCLKPGEVIVGANTSTCMDNGQWAPDPTQILLDCKGTNNLYGIFLWLITSNYCYGAFILAYSIHVIIIIINFSGKLW